MLSGRGKLAFERRFESNQPIIEPIELSISALGRVLGLVDGILIPYSNENDQAARICPPRTYHLKNDDGHADATSEVQLSSKKEAGAWRTSKPAVFGSGNSVFNLKLALQKEQSKNPASHSPCNA